MEISRIEDNIVIKNGIDGNIIESYSFDKEINFSGLTEYLLKQNLSKEIELKNNIADIQEKEQNLVNIINQIIESYNYKVKEYKKFLDDLKA